MEALATALGIPLEEGKHSLTRSDGVIQVRHDADRRTRRADVAHEIVHVLMDRGKHTRRFRKYHVTAPNLGAHMELLTEHGADQLLMPDVLVEEILEHCGYTAWGVYELSRFADVAPEQALRRLVFLDTSARAAGFVAANSHVVHVEATQYSPVWYGQRLPEPDLAYDRDVLTLFPLPERQGRLIGLFNFHDCAAD
nr:ImmA/IrrE family metallo-endopeptidase [Deinococcus arboris]